MLRNSLEALTTLSSKNNISRTSKTNITRNNQSEVRIKSEFEKDKDVFVVDWAEGRWRPVLRFSGATVLLDATYFWSSWTADLKHSDCDSDNCKQGEIFATRHGFPDRGFRPDCTRSAVEIPQTRRDFDRVLPPACPTTRN